MGLQSFGTDLNTVVFGASGGIGAAFVAALASDEAVARVHAVSRTAPDGGGTVRGHACDPLDAVALERTAEAIGADGPVHLALVATGILHGEGIAPEKTWRHIEADAMTEVLRVNTVAPALVARFFLPRLAKGRKSAFAALSARVGSIGDNRLGGWVSYRASKAALNMVIRTLSVELARTNRDALLVGMHPGTVETALSAPFRGAVPDGKLFTPDRAVAGMLAALDRMDAEASGKIFDYAGERIPE